jgi:hypothetical protein
LWFSQPLNTQTLSINSIEIGKEAKIDGSLDNVIPNLCYQIDEDFVTLANCDELGSSNKCLKCSDGYYLKKHKDLDENECVEIKDIQNCKVA